MMVCDYAMSAYESNQSQLMPSTGYYEVHVNYWYFPLKVQAYIDPESILTKAGHVLVVLVCQAY